MKNFKEIKHKEKLSKLINKIKNIEGFKFYTENLEMGFKDLEVECLQCSGKFKRKYKRVALSNGKVIVCPHCKFQPNYKVNRNKAKKCKHCKAEIKWNNSRGLIFCSNECSNESRKKTTVENWKKGLVKGLSLPEAVRDFLLSEANYKCSICSFSGVNNKTGKTVLEVDHIDGNGFNHSPDNLRILCPNCHHQTKNHGFLNFGKGRKSLLEGSPFPLKKSNQGNEEIKKETIDRYLSGGFVGIRIYKKLASFIKEKVFKNKCVECGFSGNNHYSGNSIIHLDHIDGNAFNNHPSNHRALCPNCHSKSETFRGNNRGNGREAQKNNRKP